MSIDEALQYLEVDGPCILDGVIPAGEIDDVRRSIEATVESDGSATMIQGAKYRKGLMAFGQLMAPYLADERMVGIAESLLGPQMRISMTTSAINFPGNEPGEWHADWPFNQNNAGHLLFLPGRGIPRLCLCSWAEHHPELYR